MRANEAPTEPEAKKVICVQPVETVHYDANTVFS